MNILKRKMAYGIEGYKADDLKMILNGDSNIKVDSIILNKILLDNGIRIKCIRNYYMPTNNSKNIKCKNDAKGCLYLKKSFEVNGPMSMQPFACIECHKILIDKQKKGLVKRIV